MDDIDRYLREDLGTEGDITSESLFTDEKGQGIIIAKESCIVAGLEEAMSVFTKTGAQAAALVQDGSRVHHQTTVLKVAGSIRSILKGERLALNFICRMSGIATETNDLVTRCKRLNPKVTIAATRKTTPGFRKYEKKAVVLGGGDPHRFGLYDMILIKDNHIKLYGSIQEALQRVQEKHPGDTIEIEVETQEDALVAAQMNADIIMLDNFSPVKGRCVAGKIRQINPHIIIEISGGITRRNIANYADFADRISLGSLTHSVKSKDFSLEATPV
ncbi:MAG: carboxylating nicotinate-nucleotide diphosphorylase [Methanobacteriota archaeon]